MILKREHTESIKNSIKHCSVTAAAIARGSGKIIFLITLPNQRAVKVKIIYKKDQ